MGKFLKYSTSTSTNELQSANELSESRIPFLLDLSSAHRIRNSIEKRNLQNIDAFTQNTPTFIASSTLGKALTGLRNRRPRGAKRKGESALLERQDQSPRSYKDSSDSQRIVYA